MHGSRVTKILAAIWQVYGLVCPPGLTGGAAPKPAALSGNYQLIRSYVESAPVRRAAVEGTETVVEIEARLPKLNKTAVLKALRCVSSTGEVSFQTLSFSGDPRLKREVIARYLAAEAESRDRESVAISPANYEFRLKSVVDAAGQAAWIFHLKPKKRRVGLFRGELWLDPETGMPLREAGQFVKSPSIFLKKIQFVRQYEIRGGVSIPKSIVSTVETRVAGRAELTVLFHNFNQLQTSEVLP